MNFDILDERHVWYEAAIAAAERHGHVGRRIRRGAHAVGPGIGFIRPHADPAILEQNQEDYRLMCDSGLTMIQDPEQVAVYENKTVQWEFWSKFMPRTWRFCRKEDALAFVESTALPVLVSKADVGASSVNVRILKGPDEQRRHIEQIFTRGIWVNHCSGGAKSLQKDYVLLQEFIPHEITWRVNRVGTKMAGFKRYCYPDRNVAQTGNVEPMMEPIDALLEYADQVFRAIGTKWCALDILWDAAANQYKLIETSLAWPWPSPGNCNAAPFFGTSYRWIDMWDLMFDEFEKGVWNEG